ncbi:YciI family protein [Flavobacterium amniphilum]|uniref:YciI family protein n=1 Tax=Flavobacterium amniphilum TaxID=1834035 RepID=UPI00202A79B4|nr:YciI family protein [Flavobacterium amniphilum]MCL9805902.1 YciI family protein [Flavobacterium amniphilum]
MKNIFYTLILFCGITSHAQTDNLNPYDEKLAKELGADEYGMKHYVFCILKTGSNTTATAEEKKKYFEGHMANINKLAEEGKLAVAGPFMKNDRNYRGIFIFNCATVEEAQKLVETDPAVKAKIFEVELTPWYSSAALMQVSKNHDKVAKTKF